MNPSIERILIELERANEELIRFVESCSPADLSAIVPGDGWTVAADAHHCAVGHVRASGWIELMRQGLDVPGSSDTHNEGNASHATEYEQADAGETIELLRRNVATAAATLATLTDEELELTAVHGPAGGVRLSVGQMAGAFPGHVLAHLERMRAALDRAGSTT